MTFNQSLLFRDNEENVKKEFNDNKAQQITTNELQNPEKMEVGKLNKKKEEEEDVKTDPVDTEDFEEAFRFIRARYCHEKKKIIFIMYTVRKLRNIAKLKYVYNQLTEKFMLAACLLLQKGLIYNERTIQSLKKGTNIFNLNNFKEFQ